MDEDDMPSPHNSTPDPVDPDAEERTRGEEAGVEKSTGVPETAKEGTQTTGSMAASEGVQSSG